MELLKLNEIWKIFINEPLMAALIAQLSSQIVKIFLPLLRGEKINLSKFVHYGDIPSAHTAFVVALTFSIAFNYGWDSPLLAICGVVGGIIIYDILKLRTVVEISLDASKKFMEKENITPDKKIPQFKGHSALEVVTGIIWGIIVAIVVRIVFNAFVTV